MKRLDLNLSLFLALVIVYIIGQFLIGTYSPADKKFHYDTPADVDFLYYGAIGNHLLNQFPPENPAMAGEKLTQPFLQYYPLALLAEITNPYNGIRILNVLYLVIAGLVLRRYFPRTYFLPLVILFAGSTFMAKFNALSVDEVARGFTHAPSIILLIITFFGRDLRWRAGSIFLASLINGYMMLMVLPAVFIIFILDRKKEDLYLFLAGIAGLAAASLYISAAAPGKSLFAIFKDSFAFDPWENLKHIAPFLIISFIYRNRQMMILLGTAFIFGSFIHYNVFFPIFMIYFAGAMMTAGERVKIEKGELLACLVTALLFVGFLISAFQKYNPNRGDYFPRYDSRLDGVFRWVKDNTGSSDCFLALTADEKDLALIMQYRPVYLGYIGHLAHLGADLQGRYDQTSQIFKMGKAPEAIDYIFYGPVERLYFPNALLIGPAVYKDQFVTIVRATH